MGNESLCLLYSIPSFLSGTIGRSGGRGMAPSVPSAPSEASLRRPQEETGASGSQPGVLGFNLNASKQARDDIFYEAAN